MKPSEMIRRGAPLMAEESTAFIARDITGPCGCALGTMLAGKYGEFQKAEDTYMSRCVGGSTYVEPVPFIARRCGLPLAVALEVNDLHAMHGISRATIADWLEQEGY